MEKSYEDNLSETIYQLSAEYEDLVRQYHRLTARLNLLSPFSSFYRPLLKHSQKLETRMKKTKSKIHKLRK